MCYRAEKYAVCRRFRAFFSPEILQAGEVKWFKTCTGSHAFKNQPLSHNVGHI